MKGFWHRFAQHNAPFLVAALEELADQIRAIEPGSPVAAYPVAFITKEGVTIMDLTIQDTSGPLAGRVQFTDAEGNPTTADDVPAWSSSDESVATVAAEADGLSATVTPTGALGATVIGVDSVRSSDQVDVHAQATLTVVASEEVAGEVTLTPVAVPEPAPEPEPTPEPIP